MSWNISQNWLKLFSKTNLTLQMLPIAFTISPKFWHFDKSGDTAVKGKNTFYRFDARDRSYLHKQPPKLLVSGLESCFCRRRFQFIFPSKMYGPNYQIKRLPLTCLGKTVEMMHHEYNFSFDLRSKTWAITKPYDSVFKSCHNVTKIWMKFELPICIDK